MESLVKFRVREVGFPGGDNETENGTAGCPDFLGSLRRFLAVFKNSYLLIRKSQWVVPPIVSKVIESTFI